MGYLGSKAGQGVFQAIIASMPAHDTYIELFVGSGAVLARKPPAARSIAVDLDAAVLSDVQRRHPDVRCVNDDALAFLDRFDFGSGGRVLIYADPPYLHFTRTSRHRYTHELTDDQHLALIRRLLAVPASVILSGYPSPLYDRELAAWRSVEFQAMTRGGPRTEKLWLNFPPDAAVQWATFAGRNFTDRQRIRRKAARWADQYSRLPSGERLAVLAAILETEHREARRRRT